jgi:hypothetical protein
MLLRAHPQVPRASVAADSAVVVAVVQVARRNPVVAIPQDPQRRRVVGTIERLLYQVATAPDCKTVQRQLIGSRCRR